MYLMWDETKRLANLEKHGLDLAAADEDFFGSSVVQPARHGRYKALGVIAGVAVVAIFKPLGSEAFAVISLRRASKKERRGV